MPDVPIVMRLLTAAAGVLERYGVRMLGASIAAIEVAESREHFRQAMLSAGIPVPQGRTVSAVDEALAFAAEIGYPVLVRPSRKPSGIEMAQATATPGNPQRVLTSNMTPDKTSVFRL